MRDEIKIEITPLDLLRLDEKMTRTRNPVSNAIKREAGLSSLVLTEVEFMPPPKYGYRFWGIVFGGRRYRIDAELRLWIEQYRDSRGRYACPCPPLRSFVVGSI